VSLLTTGGLVERRRWARPVELARVAAVAAGLVALALGAIRVTN
jgi:hypothetical protein